MANGADGHITLKTNVDTNGISSGIKTISSLTIGSAKKIAGAVTAITSAAAQKYGNQCVVLSADIKRVDGKFMLFAKGGRENTGLDALENLPHPGVDDMVRAIESGNGSRRLSSSP